MSAGLPEKSMGIEAKKRRRFVAAKEGTLAQNTHTHLSNPNDMGCSVCVSLCGPSASYRLSV